MKRSRSRRRSKSKVRIPVRKGTLSKYGYKSSKPAGLRRASLKRAVAYEGYLPVYRKLIAIATLQKNRNPVVSRKFRHDAKFIKNNF